jgi:hypothetical protein
MAGLQLSLQTFKAPAFKVIMFQFTAIPDEVTRSHPFLDRLF